MNGKMPKKPAASTLLVNSLFKRDDRLFIRRISGSLQQSGDYHEPEYFNVIRRTSKIFSSLTGRDIRTVSGIRILFLTAMAGSPNYSTALYFPTARPAAGMSNRLFAQSHFAFVAAKEDIAI